MSGGQALLALICAVVFGPTLVGVLDATWYFYSGHILTSIDWTDGRLWYAIGMPVLAGSLFSLATT